jgi:hypothetical protein
MDDHDRTPLIAKAITMAATNHRFAEDIIFYSDRGSIQVMPDMPPARSSYCAGPRSVVLRRPVTFN